MRRVPALLETVAVVEQSLKSLKVVDIVETQRRPAPLQTVERKGCECANFRRRIHDRDQCRITVPVPYQ